MCANKNRNKNNFNTTEQFIIDSTKAHNGLFDYSLTEYISTKHKVEIICKEHGSFWQWPSDHRVGIGCKQCGIERRVNRIRKPLEQFIIEANITHNNKYTYEKAIYTNTHAKIEITCREHGSFWQIAKAHVIEGTGCPLCSECGFRVDKPAILYYIKVERQGYIVYKIGITNRTVKARFHANEMQDITILQTVECVGQEALDRETEILRKYKQYQYNGPDLLHSGNTEMFTIDILNLDKGTTHE